MRPLCCARERALFYFFNKNIIRRLTFILSNNRLLDNTTVIRITVICRCFLFFFFLQFSLSVYFLGVFSTRRETRTKNCRTTTTTIILYSADSFRQNLRGFLFFFFAREKQRIAQHICVTYEKYLLVHWSLVYYESPIRCARTPNKLRLTCNIVIFFNIVYIFEKCAI